VYVSYLPSSVKSILSSFDSCFYAPTFENFVALVLGWILCRGPHTISRVIVAARAFGLTARHHSTLYRFLAEAAWCPDHVGHVVFDLLQPFLPEQVEAAVDDTLCHRTGPHLFGAGMHHDAATSTYSGSGGRRTSFAFGHNWVVFSIHVPYPWNPQRGIAVPILFRLYRSKKLCPETLYQKRTALADELLRILASWLSEAQGLDLAGDGEYACQTLLKSMPENVVFTGPMPMDAALNEPVKATTTKGPGRPRKKGKRLPSPAQRARCRKQWKRRKVSLYGREVTILIQTWVCLWYTVRGTVPVRVVLTRDPRGRLKDRAFFCTDASRSAEEILRTYCRRWKLEVAFETAKQSLGLEDPRNGWWRRPHGQCACQKKAGPQPRGRRGSRAVERTVPLVFAAYAFVVVWYFRYGRPEQDVARVRRRKPWYTLKEEPSFEDMIAALRRKFWGWQISKHPSLRPHRAKLIPLLEAAASVA